jgi:hypothetical protein
MEQAARGAPWRTAVVLSRILTSGTSAAVTAGWRAGTGGLQLCLCRSPTLVKLAVESGTSADRAAVAASGLRDEMLGLVRELADLSWRETRRALDDLDAQTRVEDPVVPLRARRVGRVKP